MARLSVGAMTLEDGAVVRTRECVFHICHAWLMLHSACVDWVRSGILKVLTCYCGWICGRLVCEGSLELMLESFCNAGIRVGSGTLGRGQAFQISLLIKGPSSGCGAGGGWPTCQSRFLLIHRRAVSVFYISLFLSCKQRQMITFQALMWEFSEPLNLVV